MLWARDSLERQRHKQVEGERVAKRCQRQGRHHIVIKVSVQHEHITIINIYMPDDRSSKYMKQTSPS